MPRLTPRDLAMSIGFVVLTAAVTALALLGLQRWAIAGIAVLVGLSMLISYAQFVVRRDTYQRIRREGRSTRDAVRQVERLVATANDRGKAAHADVTKLRDELRKVAAASKEMTGALQSTDRVSAKVSDALRADLATLREQLTQSAGAQQALSAKVAEATLESSGSRAELRGVRVAQQLFSQTVVGVKAEVSEIASLLGRSATKDDVADLGRLEEIASLLGRSATKDDVAGLERIEGVANTLHDASRTQSDALERVKEGVENADLGKLRPSITSLEWQIRRQRADIISDSQAMHQLLLRFTPEAPLPPVAGWAMSPAGLLMLTDTITKRDAGLVVECGSGSSTLWMALAMKAKARGKVVALEHLDEYAEKTRELLEAHGVADWAEVRVAPLTSVHTAHGDFQWYDTDGMTWENPIDILLVDGPPTTTGEHARYPALSVLGSLLDPSAIIVVDDADRQDEREVMTMWEREWPDLIHRTSPGQGIEVLTRASAR